MEVMSYNSYFDSYPECPTDLVEVMWMVCWDQALQPGILLHPLSLWLVLCRVPSLVCVQIRKYRCVNNLWDNP